MATSDNSTASLSETDTRRDEMHSTIEQWIADLIELIDEASVTEEFQQWLDVQSRFPNYSNRNTLLINRQCPEATTVAGYNTWRNEFDRYVKEGEQAIWIWAPIITTRCPTCNSSPSYHDRTDCDYDGTPREEWSKGLVGFKPVPVFDVSQTDGEPLPELETKAIGGTGDLLPALVNATNKFGLSVGVVAPDEWSYGAASGVRKAGPERESGPIVEVVTRGNLADMAATVIHECAHALLHFDIDDHTERSKREVEAEAVAYVVGRYCGLDTSGSAFYLAAWEAGDPETVRERLDRISRTAQEPSRPSRADFWIV